MRFLAFLKTIWKDVAALNYKKKLLGYQYIQHTYSDLGPDNVTADLYIWNSILPLFISAEVNVT